MDQKARQNSASWTTPFCLPMPSVCSLGTYVSTAYVFQCVCGTSTYSRADGMYVCAWVCEGGGGGERLIIHL